MAIAEVLGRRYVAVPKKFESDFQIEYGKEISNEVIYDDIISYLGEYRFKLPKFYYNLKFTDGALRDPHRNEPMKDVSQRALDQKIKKRQSSSREKAERSAFRRLDEKLSLANEGQTIIWASPPGPEEEGYGTYGFVYFGKVGKEQNGEKNIRMTAIRVENPTIEQFNKAISSLSFKKINYDSAEEVIANPEVSEENISEEHVDYILKTVFSFKPNEEEQEKFRHIIKEMFPLISDFTQSVKNPWKPKAEKIRELYSLENYALRLKGEYEHISAKRENIVVDFRPVARLPDIVGEYGFEPPKVAGSCPSKNTSTSGLTSSNVLSKGSILNSLFGDEIDYEFDQPGPCKKCGGSASCGPCGICRSCDLSIRASQKSSLN